MVTSKATVKVAAIVTGLAMATSMLSLAPIAHAAALTSAQVSSILGLLTSFGADAATIANVQASLTGGTPSTTTTTTSGSSCSFSRNLTIGSQGADVTCLQQALINGGFSVPAGATGYFGTQTRTAVASWQSSKNIAPAVGYFGSISRAAFNLGGSTTTTTGTTTTTTTTTTAGTGNGLKVTLASDSPNNIALVQGQAIGALAKFVFANPTATDIKVTNAGFKRIGVSNDSTLTNVYLFNGAKRLTDSAGVSNTAFNFNDPTGLFTVPAGQTYTVSVLADIAGSTSGQQVGVQLVSVTSTGTLDSSVSFPVNGYTQTVSAATLATADFNATTNPAVATMTAQNDYTVWSNSTTIGTRAVRFESFQLRNIGSIDRSAIQNFRLYVKGVQVGSAVASLASDDTVTFDLSANPVRIETGTAEIKVVADVISGSGNTFKFSLRRASDARFVDTDLSQPILATDSGGTTFTSSVVTATEATVDVGTVSVVKAAGSQSSNVSLGATNVKFATFELRAAGEDVKIEGLNVMATASAGTRGLDNGKVFLNGVQVGSTKDLTDATDVEFTFGSSFILTAGATAVVDIYADAKSTTGAAYTTGETTVVRLSTGSSNGQGQKSLSSINVPTANVTANTITISSSTLTLTKYSGYGNQTMIAGTNTARLGSFTLSTGATEGVSVNTLTVTLSAAEAATITDLMLKDNATGAQIGTTKTSASATNTFSVNVAMGASVTKVIDIYANIKSGSNIGAWVANIDASATGSVTGSTVDADALDLQTITIGTADLAAAVGTTPDTANVIAGSSLVKVGSFNFTSQYSGFTVDQIAVKIPANAATSVTSVTLRYPNASGVSTDSTATLALSSGGQTYATATFTGLTFYIPADTSKKLDVYVSLATIASGATSGAAVSVVLDAGEGYRESNSAGTVGTTLAAADLDSAVTTGKGTMYVRKSLPTLSAVALDSSVLSEGSDQALARVKVSADAAGDIDWGSMVFTVNKTSAISIGATTTLAVWSGSNQIAGTFATTTASLLGGNDALDNLTSGLLHFRPTTVETITAGGSKTYELRGTIGGTTTGSNNVSVSIANVQTTASSTAVFSSAAGTQGNSSAASFVWSDWSDLTDHASNATDTDTIDWMGDYLVKALPLTIGNRSLSI